jgi:hypothetical protein
MSDDSKPCGLIDKDKIPSDGELHQLKIWLESQNGMAAANDNEPPDTAA